MKDYAEERVNKPILKSIDAKHQEIDRLTKEIKEENATLRIRCISCKKLTQAGDLVYIQTQYYIEPHGCTGGDYWVDDEGQFQCPKCGTVNRLIRDRENISSLKHYFKEIKRA